MRIIGEIPHDTFKITLYSWNEKYILKIESGPYEQSYKISEYDIEESDLPGLIQDEFMKKVSRRFIEMHQDLTKQLESL